MYFLPLAARRDAGAVRHQSVQRLWSWKAGAAPQGGGNPFEYELSQPRALRRRISEGTWRRRVQPWKVDQEEIREFITRRRIFLLPRCEAKVLLPPLLYAVAGVCKAFCLIVRCYWVPMKSSLLKLEEWTAFFSDKKNILCASRFVSVDTCNLKLMGSRRNPEILV